LPLPDTTSIVFNLAVSDISMLYKRAFRKGKEVTTFLIKAKMIK
jgi:hypothetical protein